MKFEEMINFLNIQMVHKSVDINVSLKLFYNLLEEIKLEIMENFITKNMNLMK